MVEGETETPETGEPATPLRVTVVALLTVQVRSLLPPAVMTLGDALKLEMTGAAEAGLTVTVTVLLVDPEELLAVRV